ncbi:MAG: response regulator [Candidatus Rokubacteria bacterium]|nr:response regulator [Candidatus Rokubacteria bacterium]
MERKILVVEDSPTQAQHLRLLLEAEGYRVERAPNGREGLERAQVAPPDLIISDVTMPVMDGWDFCRAVKASPRLKRIPFVLLTERGTAGDIIRGLEHGADNFITKPFEDDYLRERLRRIFENLDLRAQGQLDMEVTLAAGGRRVVINADKQQIFELLFATLEELSRTNGQLTESRRAVEEYARSLEMKVQERTQQLRQAVKSATMGELLAGVAHEQNNPLSVLTGHAALLQGAADPAVTRRADKLVRAADRCARIVRNFLALARQRPPAREATRLDAVVAEAVDLLAYPLRSGGVEVVQDLAADLPVLWADPAQLHQVIVNLMTNAQQAMRASAPPRRVTLSARYVRPRAVVRLIVSDTGPGVPHEIRTRIFEPFFTTKPEGQGTGLGLPLCRSIIESHGGTISAEGDVGQGASFVIELPVVPISEPQPAAERLEPTAGRGLTILVVDDEAEVGEVLGDLLGSEGHAVETAMDGLDALERIQQRVFDLIFTDIRMPRLDGAGLYRELERRDPALARRVVLVTGDVLSSEVGELIGRLGVPALSKPLDFAEVRRMIARMVRQA